ncbi:hypothetical protein BV378_02930 [Nostoc sp. RF31YmG]|nr:hypothetical protein BV378_02930 [Nostoc sp. RF31YmG]
MASIKIFELRPIGSELFHDSESFLNELTSLETGIIKGGDLLPITYPLIEYTLLENTVVKSQYTYSVGISWKTSSVVTRANP